MRLESNDRTPRGVRPSGVQPHPAPPARRPGGPLRRLSVALLLLSTTVFLPGTASAHTVLKSSNPSAGQVLRAAPEQLELVFNEKLRPNSAQVAITVGDATPVEVDVLTGEDIVTSDLSAEKLAAVPEGTAVHWKIGYRIVSEDGHPVAGVVEFVVDRTLLSSVPAEGAVLSALPAELELSFGRPIASANPAAVSGGDQPEQQAPTVAVGETVRVSLAGFDAGATEGPQQWRVGYRVTDAEGQTLGGLLTFVIDATAGSPPTTLVPLAPELWSAATSSPPVASGVASAELSPAETSSAAVDLGQPAPATDGGGPWWIAAAVVVVLILGGIVLVLRRRAGTSASR